MNKHRRNPLKNRRLPVQRMGSTSYFDRNMPYIEKSLNPERIFWYCYVSGAGENEQKHPDDTYGIVTVYEDVRYESSLYTHLKNR